MRQPIEERERRFRQSAVSAPERREVAALVIGGDRLLARPCRDAGKSAPSAAFAKAARVTSAWPRRIRDDGVAVKRAGGRLRLRRNARLGLARESFRELSFLSSLAAFVSGWIACLWARARPTRSRDAAASRASTETDLRSRSSKPKICRRIGRQGQLYRARHHEGEGLARPGRIPSCAAIDGPFEADHNEAARPAKACTSTPVRTKHATTPIKLTPHVIIPYGTCRFRIGADCADYKSVSRRFLVKFARSYAGFRPRPTRAAARRHRQAHIA